MSFLNASYLPNFCFHLILTMDISNYREILIIKSVFFVATNLWNADTFVTKSVIWRIKFHQV